MYILSLCLVWCPGYDYLSFFPLCTFLASVLCTCVYMYAHISLVPRPYIPHFPANHGTRLPTYGPLHNVMCVWDIINNVTRSLKTCDLNSTYSVYSSREYRRCIDNQTMNLTHQLLPRDLYTHVYITYISHVYYKCMNQACNDV